MFRSLSQGASSGYASVVEYPEDASNDRGQHVGFQTYEDEIPTQKPKRLKLY